ncbi:MAG: hemolysin family protein [Actinomycetota bacterium]|nr:hemolysin family protein [Actinomycetota bacterium]
MDAEFTDSLPLIALLLGLILLAVLLAATEAALLRVSPIKARILADQGDRRSARVVAMVEDLPRVLNAVLLVVLLTQIGAATMAGYIADRHFGNLGVTLTSVGLTLVMFVYAEAIPKTIAVRHPLAVARFVARPVGLIAATVRPVVGVLVWLADLQVPGSGVMTTAAVTETELRRLAADAEKAGEIEPSDFDLIERAFRIGDASLAEVVVPRTEVVAIPIHRGIAGALEMALTSGHRRLPVYESSLDDVTGVVRLRDLAAAVAEGEEATVETLQQPALFLPESRRVIDALRDMQEEGTTMAIVVDEHGGTAGIVTIEDLVEELVGGVADEEEQIPDIRPIGPGRWMVRGSTDIDDLEVAVGVEFERRGFHTVAGLVLDATGRIPRPGEEIAVGGHRFRIAEASRRRIRLVEVRE